MHPLAAARPGEGSAARFLFRFFTSFRMTKNTDKLLVKYWAGWIKPENMDNPEWLPLWKEAAEKAESDGMELVVFRVPKNKTGSSDMVRQIEQFLQDELDK